MTKDSFPSRLFAPVLSVVLAVALTLAFAPVQAQYGPDDEAETLEAMKPKTEAEVALPPLPKPQDLLPVDTGPTSRQSFALDAKSLTVRSDQVVRYTVVSTSSSGAQNISHEGIDCKSHSFRRYAYGTKDGKWSRSRRDKWEPISSMSQNQLHYTLHSQYFCQAGHTSGSASEILTRIRYGRVLTSW